MVDLDFGLAFSVTVEIPIRLQNRRALNSLHGHQILHTTQCVDLRRTNNYFKNIIRTLSY